eukprot:1149766-Pelagomonas_calceolata.AAC.3
MMLLSLDHFKIRAHHCPDALFLLQQNFGASDVPLSNDQWTILDNQGKEVCEEARGGWGQYTGAYAFQANFPDCADLYSSCPSELLHNACFRQWPWNF